MISDLDLRNAHAPPLVDAGDYAPPDRTVPPGPGSPPPDPAQQRARDGDRPPPLAVRLAIPAGQPSPSAAEARRIVRRARAWGAALDWRVPGSQVDVLNRSGRTSVRLRPTLAAALEWAAEATWLTGGALDVSIGGWPEPEAAVPAADVPETVGVFRRPAQDRTGQGGQTGAGDSRSRIAPRWQLTGVAQRLPGEPPSRHTALLRRPGVVFDLDPIRRGWLADRTLALLADAPGALVEVDGAFAVRVAAGDRCELPVMDPFGRPDPLAVFRLEGPRPGIPAKFGFATARTGDASRGRRPGGGALRDRTRGRRPGEVRPAPRPGRRARPARPGWSLRRGARDCPRPHADATPDEALAGRIKSRRHPGRSNLGTGG